MKPEKQIFMQAAIDLSQKKMRLGAGGPFGVVIVKGNTIISSGWNKVTSTNDPTAHAEIVAIRSACRVLKTFNLKNCELYSSCEPCPMCLAAIYWSRIKKIYFANTTKDAAKIGFDDQFIYKEVRLTAKKRMIKTEQIMKEEAQKIFKEWKKKKDKVVY